jgi:hypothetical protein
MGWKEKLERAFEATIASLKKLFETIIVADDRPANWKLTGEVVAEKRWHYTGERNGQTTGADGENR